MTATVLNHIQMPRRRRGRIALAGALIALVGAGAAHAAAAPAPIAVIDTGAMVNPTITPTVTVANGGTVGDPRAHGSLMLTTIAGPGAPAAQGTVLHYGCDGHGGGVDGPCALGAMNDALDRGVRVVSLSWSTHMDTVDPAYRAAFAAAVARARANGVIVAAAAYPGGPTFPADVDGVMSVGATERDGAPAYPGDNAAVRLPTENTDGVDATGAPIVRAGSSFATAEFSARAARILGAALGVAPEQIPARVVAEANADAARADAGPFGDAADDAAVAAGVPAAVRTGAVRPQRATSAAKQRAAKRALRRATKLRGTWRGGRLVLRGRVPVRAEADVVWRGTRFACARRGCSVRLIGKRTRTVRVRVSRGDVAVVVAVPTRAVARR